MPNLKKRFKRMTITMPENPRTAKSFFITNEKEKNSAQGISDLPTQMLQIYDKWDNLNLEMKEHYHSMANYDMKRYENEM